MVYLTHNKNERKVMNYFNPLDEHRATQRRFMLAGANRCIRCRKYSFTDYAVCNKCAKRYNR